MSLHAVPDSDWLGVVIETGLPGSVVASVAVELTPSVTLKSTLFFVVSWVCKRQGKCFLYNYSSASDFK